MSAAAASVARVATVAALYVEAGGTYYDLDGVDPWDVARDARTYVGPWPVVAHPPCSRWCQLAGLVEARWGHKRGDDGGCFQAALASVRRWGGVLEHPAYSKAWRVFDLPWPHVGGGWQRGTCGGWVCHVEQGRYGHPARKASWLYAFGQEDLPSLRWGSNGRHAAVLVGWCANRIETGDARRRVTKRRAAATPNEFRDVLLTIARGATGAVNGN